MQLETIFTALFALVSADAALVTRSRRLQHWKDVPGVSQPALFLVGGDMVPTNTARIGVKWEIDATVYIYTYDASAGGVPGVLLNNRIDTLRAALAGSPVYNGKQTLGGLIEHVWISGKIETDHGTLGEQAVARVPMTILTT